MSDSNLQAELAALRRRLTELSVSKHPTPSNTESALGDLRTRLAELRVELEQSVVTPETPTGGFADPE